MTSNSHIPSDLVVDQWTSDVEGSSTLDFLFLHDVWMTFGRLICHKITSTISTAWNFTTKSGGIWQGPVEMVCKLAHCSDLQCAARAKTRSPYAETTLTLPWWLIGWDVFCWMGHRRFARHWSVPQIRGALADTSQIPLSADAIEDALQRTGCEFSVTQKLLTWCTGYASTCIPSRDVR